MGAKNEAMEWIKSIIITIIVAVSLNIFVVDAPLVKGSSMYPTSEDGQRIVSNKFTYLFNVPETGDVVIIETEERNYVKRVIGLPGDTIEVKNNNIIINGEVYVEPYLPIGTFTGNSIEEIELPKDMYYVMGDNRENSMDSRNGLELIDGKDITGRVDFIFYPFSAIGSVD